MQIIKKISIRFLCLIVIIYISNIIYKYTFYPQDAIKNGLLTTKLNYGIKNSDILFFSSSPNKAHPINDSDTRAISKILDDNLPSLNVTSVDTGAIHAGVFKKLINLIPNDNNIKYIVVNLNYRSFGIGWIMSSLENAISKKSVFYTNRPLIINRFLQGLNFYNPISKKERKEIIQRHWKTNILPFPAPKNNVIDWCAMEKWGDWTNPKRNLADHYIKNYAFVLDDSNPRIQDFDKIVEICKPKNIKLIFNILGENIEAAGHLVDSNLTKLMLKNKDYIIDRYIKKGVIIVDNFSKITDSCFYERIFPTEHYSFIGRKIIADNITKEIKHLESF